MFEVETPSVRRARFRSRGVGVDARCAVIDDRARPGDERVLAVRATA